MEATAGATRTTGHIAVADDREQLIVFPRVTLPQAPDVPVIWRRLMVVGWIVLGYFLLSRLSVLLYDYWILDHLGYGSIFWTNFRMMAGLFAAGAVVFAAAVIVPALLYPLGAGTRRGFIAAGVFVGIIAGYRLQREYLEFLEFFNGRTFGVEDPVFGNDIGFYVFELDSWWVIMNAVVWALLIGLAASLLAAWLAYVRPDEQAGLRRISRAVAHLSTPLTLGLIGALGVVWAIEFWFRRYDLLIKDNEDSKIFNGAEAIDVTGFFSTRNDYLLTAIVEVAIAGVIIYALLRVRRAVFSPRPVDWKPLLRTATIAVVVLLGVDFAFKVGVTLRDDWGIKPDEPVVQVEYLQRHVDATLTGYRLTEVDVVALDPGQPGAALPDVEAMLQSPTLRNAPLWPGFNSELEQVLDPQHTDRLLLTDGDFTVYGPTMDTFTQEQKLRPYYDFLSVDTVAYEVNGERLVFASSVRETPVDPYAPMPWLLHWSQQHLIYTHGYGLVAVPVNGVDPDGGPNYVASQIPTHATDPQFALDAPFVYFGEGQEAMAFTHLGQPLEIDVLPDTEQGDPGLPPDVDAGVPVDSLLKRIVFGWRSGFPIPVLFSSLIDDDSQALYYRIPIERLERIAPFVYFDTNAYAVAADGRMQWMVHGMTTSARYPYSRMGDLGDKADIRSPIVRPHRQVNYVEDSVKATVDATTGEVRLYKISDDPVVDMWAEIYPDLFIDGAEMPPSIRSQVQYSPRLFHIQFDDIWWQYHMGDGLEYYNADDIWDDGDEVLGPVILDGESLSFSIEPYYWLADTGGMLPESSSGSQFVMSQVFTPESAINLQAMSMVYMDGEDYGRLVVLETPRGTFIPGPEQADAAIDQQPEISEQISWWNRLGNEVIRGHTSALIVGDELVYVEPLFIRSAQNPLPQLKRVVVVFRGHAAMGETVEEALRLAIQESGEETDEAQAAAFPAFRIDP